MTPETQLTDTVLLVRPAAFGFNPDTARTNAFQNDDGRLTPAEIQARAVAEFDAFVEQLRASGLRVIVFPDPGPTPPTPDSIFPNNWVSFHPGGQAVLYPMHAPSRRAERRPAVLAQLAAAGHPYPQVLDLSGWEATGQYLEGTGSLVLDRARRVAYAALSPRTDATAVALWAARLGYELVVFEALDASGTPIYHTNVLLSVGATVAVACFEALPDSEARTLLHTRLATDGRLVVPITHPQMSAFAGNMLQVQPAGRGPLLIMSGQAWRALSGAQQAALLAHTEVLVAPLDTIEQYGGGSARCMLAEVF
jgi:hypothetical protein